MISRSLTLAIIIALLTTLASAGSSVAGSARGHTSKAQGRAFPVTVTDALGVKVTITARPKRIISLDPRDTETLFALGLEKRIVADGGSLVEGAACCKTRFAYPQQWPSPWGANYPSKSKTLPHVEGGYDAAHPFNMEAVVAARPDLVFSLSSGSQLGVYQKMRSLGMKVIVLDPHTFTDIEKDIALVGRATGAVKQAKVVLGNIKRRYKAVVRALRPVTSEPRVFYEIDDSTGTPYSACAGSFIDQLLSLAKAHNIAHDVTPCPASDPYPQISTESIVARNPQIIILGDANYGTTPAQVAARNGWNVISAVKHNKVYPFDDDLVSRGGPREIVGLETLARLLHPHALHVR